MSVSRIIQQAAAGNAGEAVYVDDVFSTYLYDGTGSAQTITNGIDLDGEGGLVWTKERSDSANHHLYDTERGALKRIFSNTTDGEQSIANSLTSFNSDGFSLGTGGTSNANGEEYASWAFRKQPGFFDVVTYTGTGSVRTVSHNLGSVPGMIIIKRTSSSGSNWRVYHTSLGNGQALSLNTTDAAGATTSLWNNTTPTDSVFTLGDNGNVNQLGQDFVAYLFAHDDSDESIIKCGSFTTDGSGNATVNLGFEPQWVMVKATNQSYNWEMYDVLRGFSANGHKILSPNSTAAETNNTTAENTQPTSTGFSIGGNYWGANVDLIYMAIRRPNKPAEEFAATDLFGIDNNTGQTGINTNVLTDFGFAGSITTTDKWYVGSRLTEGAVLNFSSTAAQSTSSAWNWDQMQGMFKNAGTWNGYIGYGFRRAPGFFDVVPYKSSTAISNIPHNLGAVPELVILKMRYRTGSSYGGDRWYVYHKDTGINAYLGLNQTNAVATHDGIFSSTPTSTNLPFSNPSNDSLATSDTQGRSSYVAYLFATVPGISKVGSYTGTSSPQTIDCGFSNGARFVLIKQSSSGGGDWRLFDTERGIIVGNDPMLSLNNTNASSAYDDYLVPEPSGFRLAGNPSNASGSEFIFLAIA